MNGTLHLIPVGLGDADIQQWLPSDVQDTAAGLDLYIAENAKSARAFLKQAGTRHVLQDVTIHTLAERTSDTEIQAWLQPLREGRDIGLVSEAGCPAVADPGARVVAQAHAMGCPVSPHVGPSAIMLSLMASGLEGQRFAFHGYAPVAADERQRQLKQWEQASRQWRQTQILIETPYRNAAMFQALLQSLQPQTRVCVAYALATPDAAIATHTVAQWRKLGAPAFERQPCMFLFLAG